MYGQEIFGELFLYSLILFIWTTYITNRIITYLFSKNQKSNLLFYQCLTFLIVTGLIFLFFKIDKIDTLFTFYIIVSFLSGIYLYLFLKRRQIPWLTKLETHSVGLKIVIPFMTVLVTAGLFALVILGLFRLM